MSAGPGEPCGEDAEQLGRGRLVIAETVDDWMADLSMLVVTPDPHSR